jgi:AAA domain, putative AbiEii toxin, Type IV TA system
MPNPEEEEIGWDQTFAFLRNRYQDTIHSMFRMIEAQRQGIANRAIELRRAGRTEMSLNFADPMEPFKLVFSRLLAPKELVNPSPSQQQLQYTFDGQTFDLQSLSSGEREVVNIAFDFLLRRPHDCIVVFDEPELHLHPELSYRLIQTLQAIGDNNQFIFCTHSPDIIAASLDRSVVFVAPPRTSADGTPANQAVPVSEGDDTNQALRLLGQSVGIIALGKKIVLVEGEQSSLDKQVYGSIIRNRFSDLVLVPSGGKHVIQSFSTVYHNVLARAIWGVDFFMLCDGDSAPLTAPDQVEAARDAGRLRVLSRYHLENYFLDDDIWAEVFASMEPAGSWLRDPARIRGALREIASSLVSYGAALTASSQIRLAFGNLDVMPSGAHAKSRDELSSLIRAKLASERARFEAQTTEEVAVAIVTERFDELSASIAADTDDWKKRIPGKPMLAQFAGRAQISLGRAKILYVAAAARRDPSPFDEIIGAFAAFAATTR